MVEKDPQQSIFCPAQRDDSAVIIQQMTRGGIQLPVAKRNQSAGFGNLQIGWQRARRRIALIRASSSRATKGLTR